jgi:hypothetical protein
MTKQDDARRHGRSSKNTTADDGGSTMELKGRAAVPAASRSVPPLPRRDDAAIAEQHVRTRGKWMTIAGLITVALTFILDVVWNEGFNYDMPVGYVLPLYAIAFGAVAVGGMEYLSRHHRQALVQCIDQVAKVERGMFALVDLMDEDKKQAFWQGYSAHAKDQLRQTGTDNATGGRFRTGEVLHFRQRNDGPLS